MPLFELGHDADEEDHADEDEADDDKHGPEQPVDGLLRVLLQPLGLRLQLLQVLVGHLQRVGQRLHEARGGAGWSRRGALYHIPGHPTKAQPRRPLKQRQQNPWDSYLVVHLDDVLGRQRVGLEAPRQAQHLLGQLLLQVLLALEHDVELGG